MTAMIPARLRAATNADVSAILAIYRESIGHDHCVWDDHYPTADNIAHDLAVDCLFVLENNTGVIGAVSVESENELADLDDAGVFRYRINACETARVCIARRVRGQGYAHFMLTSLYGILKARGCRAVRLLAARDNPAAVALYRSLGFEERGQTYRYGFDYILFEKQI